MKKFFTILFLLLVAGWTFAQKTWAQSNENKIVKFYPNPAVTTYITFDIQKPIEEGYVIQIYNFIGRRVLTIPIFSQKITVSIDNFFRGVYIFQLRDKNGNIIESNKFQVNK